MRRNAFRRRLDDFINSQGIAHEVVVVVVSYLFVFAGAWNDGYVGLVASPASGIVEACMAAILVLEITSRLLFVRERRFSFYALIVLDIVSLLTVIPYLTGFAFARLFRLGYASWRTALLLERLANAREQCDVFSLDLRTDRSVGSSDALRGRSARRQFSGEELFGCVGHDRRIRVNAWQQPSEHVHR